MIKTCLGIGFILIPALASATTWVCHNKDMEITCTPEKCTSSGGFTPMNISFSDHGSMTICAYSGCWEGKGTVLISGNHILISGHKLDWRGATHGSDDFMVALDESTGIAVVNGDGFAMPLICRPENMAKPPHAEK